MITTATNVRRIDPNIVIPDGVYNGIGVAYRVVFKVDGVEYEANTFNGIRTPPAKCTVTVKSGVLSVEVK